MIYVVTVKSTIPYTVAPRYNEHHLKARQNYSKICGNEPRCRPVAEVFGRVFVLTEIFIKGVIKYEREGASLQGGLEAAFPPPPENILKSRGPEMLFSALCTSMFQTR